MLGPVLDELAQEVNNQEIAVLKVDVDQFQAIAQQYQVRSIPTLLLVEDGQVVDAQLGFMPKQSIVEWIEQKTK